MKGASHHKLCSQEDYLGKKGDRIYQMGRIVGKATSSILMFTRW